MTGKREQSASSKSDSDSDSDSDDENFSETRVRRSTVFDELDQINHTLHSYSVIQEKSV